MADQAEIGGVAGAGKPCKQKEGVFTSYARRDGKLFAGKLRDDEHHQSHHPRCVRSARRAAQDRRPRAERRWHYAHPGFAQYVTPLDPPPGHARAAHTMNPQV